MLPDGILAKEALRFVRSDGRGGVTAEVGCPPAWSDSSFRPWNATEDRLWAVEMRKALDRGVSVTPAAAASAASSSAASAASASETVRGSPAPEDGTVERSEAVRRTEVRTSFGALGRGRCFRLAHWMECRHPETNEGGTNRGVVAGGGRNAPVRVLPPLMRDPGSRAAERLLLAMLWRNCRAARPPSSLLSESSAESSVSRGGSAGSGADGSMSAGADLGGRV